MRTILKSLVLILLLSSAGCNQLTEFEPNSLLLVLTFDDQHISIYEKAFPLMREFGFVGVNAVNSGYLGKANTFSWNNLIEMDKEYGWETAGHTLSHANLPDCTDAELIHQIEQDLQNFRSKGLLCETFVLPRGHATERDFAIIQSFYRNIRTSQDSRMYAPVNRYRLGYFPYLSSYSADDAILRIKEGIFNKENLIIIGFHRFDDPSDSHNCSSADFAKILRFVSEKKLKVVTINTAMNLLTK